MIRTKPRIFKYGNSLGMRLPKNLDHSEYATCVAENLILADPTGGIPEEVLEGWLNEIEDKRIDFLKDRKSKRKQLKIL